jgi:hypothetical protein
MSNRSYSVHTWIKIKFERGDLMENPGTKFNQNPLITLKDKNGKGLTGGHNMQHTSTLYASCKECMKIQCPGTEL